MRNSPNGVRFCSPVSTRGANLLLCDHRGSGLGRRLASLRTEGWLIDVTHNLNRTLERLGGPKPDALVLDPLIEGGAEEIERLDRAGAELIPLLLLADPTRIAEVAPIWAPPSGRVVDIAHRDADPLEVQVRLERLEEASALRAELHELRHRASHDDRTELLRPEAFERRLVEHWSAAQRHAHRLALVIADLDRFGQINKEHDHTLGDRVLERVGVAIRSALRMEDVAGRLGGDEFGFILPYTKKSDAARAIERVRARIQSVSGRIDGVDLVVSASLGFETFDGRDVPSLRDLRLHAEVALREAKQRGGACAVDYRSLPLAVAG